MVTSQKIILVAMTHGDEPEKILRRHDSWRRAGKNILFVAMTHGDEQENNLFVAMTHGDELANN
jgi:hypothetical protein